MIIDPLFSVEGKVVLITGAGGGIGSALARAFLARGATIAAVDREPALLKQLVASAGIDVARLLPFSFDLSATEQISGLVDQIIARAGRVEVLINNAGINRPGPADEVNEADWDAILAVNLKACFFLAQAVARHMQRQGGGRIINIASVLGLFGRELNAAYAAGKGGFVILTKSLALEWAQDKILVNAIAPGLLRTPMSEPFLETPKQVQAANALVPLGRLGAPEEIVGVALLLASEAGSYITGSVLVVDGGYSAI